MIKNMAARARHATQRVMSRRALSLVLVGAFVSQVLVIGGLAVWATRLGATATGSLPASLDAPAAITVWVSDPRWHVAPELDVAQHTWTVSLSSPQDSSFDATDPTAEAVIVLWGAARLVDPHPEFGFLGTPFSYSEVQVPVAQESEYAGSEGLPSEVTVPAQVFAFTTREDGVITGMAPPGLYAQTSTGWAAYVPDMGTAALTSASTCQVKMRPLPAAIAGVLSDGKRPWYGTTCPPPAARVQLLLGEDESLSSSTFPPTSAVSSNGDPVWTTSRDSFIGSYLTGFWVDVFDPAVAAAAQRDLLISGILFGISGGLVATWIFAGVTYAVSRAISGGKSEPRSGPASTADPGSPATDQAAGRSGPGSNPGQEHTRAATGNAPPSLADDASRPATSHEQKYRQPHRRYQFQITVTLGR